MKTIIEELKEVAKQCKSSKEFTQRAKSYLKCVKGIEQDIMSDCDLRDVFREVSHKLEVEKCWEKFENTIRPMLYEREDCKKLWYECWIDLKEDWEEKWFACFRFMRDKDIVEVCATYLNEQDRYYDSDDHYDALDRMVAGIDWEKDD